MQMAEAEATALKERTLREIEGAKQQALTEINNHAAELGTAVGKRKILQRNVTARRPAAISGGGVGGDGEEELILSLATTMTATRRALKDHEEKRS